jgi:hypothetical protein
MERLRPSNIMVSVSGRDFYEWIEFPTVPRKGDLLDLGSLTSGAHRGVAVVSEVRWLKNQIDRFVYPTLTIRRKSQ